MKSRVASSEFSNIRISSRKTLVFENLQKYMGALKLFLQFIISVFVPLLCFLVYQDYALSVGIKIEQGCEGPGISFGMLSGILFTLFLRSNCNSHKSKL